jgi:hypothetical protein
MKIKLQDYGLINIKMMDDMIKELEGFKTGDVLKDLPTRSLIGTLEGLKQQLIPAEISDDEIEKAKQMEKEQIIKAASVVLWHNSSNSTETAEQYYNDTYGK